MAKKIIEVEDKKKSKISLNKIKDVIVENKDTIVKIMDIAEDFFDDEEEVKKTKKKSATTSKKASSKSKSTNKKSNGKSTGKKKSTKSAKNSSDLATVIDIAGKLLK